MTMEQLESDKNPSAPPPPPSPKKFYIYSSKAGKRGDLSEQRDSNTDKFLSLLTNKGIVLEDTPSPSAKIDSSDHWAKWLQLLANSGEYTVTVGGTPKKIDSFSFKFDLPLFDSGPAVFSSSPAALVSSFGLTNGIPVPGIRAEGNLLYCGLDPEETTQKLKTTVKKAFKYIGQQSAAKSLPALLSGLTLTLDPSKCDGKRNALWFNPAFHSQTTVRLELQIDAIQTVKNFFESHLSGLAIREAVLICKKVLIATETTKGPCATDQGEAVFSFRCQLEVPNRSTAILSVSADFRHNTLALTFQPDLGGDVLTTILIWLAGLAGLAKTELDNVQQILQQNDIFENVHFREVTLNLGIDDKGKPTGVNSFGISIEVCAKMGKGSSQKSPVFLLTYQWDKDDGTIGGIEGQLWNWFDQTGFQKSSPYYEWWREIQPISTPTPATSIDLVSIVPGTTIKNVPDFIPTEITRASISLSKTSFTIGGTIESEKPKGSVPHPSLGLVQLDVSYTWGTKSDFSVALALMADLTSSSNRPSPTTLIGKLEYQSSTQTWMLLAQLEGLYASSLYEFFDKGSSDQVMPLIESIEIQDLEVRYKYAGKSAGGSGSSFSITGDLLIAGLELTLEFTYATDWTFIASLKPQDAQATIGQVVAGILGDEQPDLPDFIADTQFSNGNKLDLVVKKEKGSATEGRIMETNSSATSDAPQGSFHFIATIVIGDLVFTFAQYRGADYPKDKKSKRLIQLALRGFKIPEIELIGKMEQPFDELGLIWVQDPVTTKGPHGLTRKEIENINLSLGKNPVIFKDKIKENEKKDEDVLITAGSHFSIIMNNASGAKSCVLFYGFNSGSKKKQPPSQPGTTVITDRKEDKIVESESEGSDGTTAQAPFKKKSGPLALKNIGLKYANNQLHIMLDAIFQLGPLEFALLGFGIPLEIAKLNNLPIVHKPTLEGLSLGFAKRPLTIAGIIRHGTNPGLEYYAGGLVVGFIPYEFVAAGFYGKATPKEGKAFVSMFLFAKLNGPLFELGFAEISGVTGGFGYNSNVRTPAPNQVATFPFVATNQLGDKTGSAMDTLVALTSQGPDGWFHSKNETYWGAAGLKVNAFQMLSVDAVAVVQFGQAIKLGIFAVAIADIPSTKASLKFAHVELGLAVVVDFDYGTMKVEGQLSPNSFILHPDCHLTGGFGLYYWFDGPHADRSIVGEFVFTLGGYHQSFTIPDGYPNPPRLGISWSLSQALSITGEAYFAITPKACMGGGRLHASFSAGPIEAWFDARADFLINYRPFTFTAGISISVGVRISIDIWFVHTSVSAELGALLTLWGPPVAGKVHVDFWVTSFDVNFGAGPLESKAISLIEFYELVLQAGDKPSNLASLPAPTASDEKVQKRNLNEGHTFLALSGLVNAGEKTERHPGDSWTVRAGTFSFSVSCKMAAQSVSQGDNTIVHSKPIYSRPMHLENSMSSTVSITITQKGQQNKTWKMEKQVKSVPTALWDKYSSSTDPSNGGNHISSLLDTDNSTVSLMMGVLFNVPPPILSPDKLPPTTTADKTIVDIAAHRKFPVINSSADEWEPAPSVKEGQWNAVHDAWKNPTLGTGSRGAARFVDLFASAFHWDKTGFKLTSLASLPKRMDARFDDLFVAAPLISKG